MHGGRNAPRFPNLVFFMHAYLRRASLLAAMLRVSSQKAQIQQNAEFNDWMTTTGLNLKGAEKAAALKGFIANMVSASGVLLAGNA